MEFSILKITITLASISVSSNTTASFYIKANSSDFMTGGVLSQELKRMVNSIQ